ncbi:hypothetical protein SynRCC2555_02134 [Synechococcus sp. WH 8101]|nr:hypothetical protein SynRCC2555_02134 [Synechococcus sp. WH 8101]
MRDALALHHHPLSYLITHALFVSFWARMDAAAVVESSGFGGADSGGADSIRKGIQLRHLRGSSAG